MQGWQLTKDRKELKAQIKELKESSCPNAKLLGGFKAQLVEINEEISRRGTPDESLNGDLAIQPCSKPSPALPAKPPDDYFSPEKVQARQAELDKLRTTLK